MHLGVHLFTEASASRYGGLTSGPGRHKFMTQQQATGFLIACRHPMPGEIPDDFDAAEISKFAL